MRDFMPDEAHELMQDHGSLHDDVLGGEARVISVPSLHPKYRKLREVNEVPLGEFTAKVARLKRGRRSPQKNSSSLRRY